MECLPAFLHHRQNIKAKHNKLYLIVLWLLLDYAAKYLP